MSKVKKASAAPFPPDGPSAQPRGKRGGEKRPSARGRRRDRPSPAAKVGVVPHYDIEARELSVAGEVVFRLSVQARKLAAILTSLELAGWRPRISKPLSSRPRGNNRHDLGSAAYTLNRRQSLIEFHADGDGIRWNWHSTAAPSTTPRGRRGRTRKRTTRRVRPPHR